MPRGVDEQTLSPQTGTVRRRVRREAAHRADTDGAGFLAAADPQPSVNFYQEFLPEAAL